MANHSRWDEVKASRPAPNAETRTGIEQDLALGQLIYGLRTEAGLSQRALAERMGTTQSVISRLEEGGGAKNRLDTLARVATALGRHLVVSFPEKVPARIKDGVQVA
ncbi:MAG TPA: helix-turn-helix transcriptional regulator [Acidimicrobiales bacterium]